LRDAYLWGANLSEAAFEQARLGGAFLRDAELVNTRFTTATYNNETVFPDGFDVAASGALPSDRLYHAAVLPPGHANRNFWRKLSRHR